MKLDLGCGDGLKRDGYMGVDMVELKGVDYVCNLGTDPLPFEGNTIEAISTSHFLEHLIPDHALQVLEESYRVLEGGGEIDIVVPNLPKILEIFLQAPFEAKWTWWEATIFGSRNGPGQFHKCGFDESKLHAYLEKAGFKEIVIEEVWTHSQPCLRATARKPRATVIRPRD